MVHGHGGAFAVGDRGGTLGRPEHGDFRHVLLHGVVVPELHLKVVDGEIVARIADLLGVAGHAVDRVLLMEELAQGETHDQEQDAQVAHPGPPEPQPVFAGEQHLLARHVVRFRLGQAEPFKDQQRVGHACRGRVRGGGQSGLGVRLPLRAGDQRLQAGQVAQEQVPAEEGGEGQEPPAVERVVESKARDQRRRALAVDLRVPRFALPLGHKAGDDAGSCQHHQQRDGEAHGG